MAGSECVTTSNARYSVHGWWQRALALEPTLEKAHTVVIDLLDRWLVIRDLSEIHKVLDWLCHAVRPNKIPESDHAM
jgi:hypothetical protein